MKDPDRPDHGKPVYAPRPRRKPLSLKSKIAQSVAKSASRRVVPKPTLPTPPWVKEKPDV